MIWKQFVVIRVDEVAYCGGIKFGKA